MLFLQIVTALTAFLNKLLLSVNKPYIGWVFGAISAVCEGVLSFSLGYFQWTVLAVYASILYVIGFVKEFKKKEYKLFDRVLLVITSLVTLSVAFFSKDTLMITIVQSIMIFGFMIAVQLLGNKNKLGWIFMVIGHLTLAYLNILTKTYVIVGFQILSLVPAFLGYFGKITVINKSEL